VAPGGKSCTHVSIHTYRESRMRGPTPIIELGNETYSEAESYTGSKTCPPHPSIPSHPTMPQIASSADFLFFPGGPIFFLRDPDKNPSRKAKARHRHRRRLFASLYIHPYIRRQQRAGARN